MGGGEKKTKPRHHSPSNSFEELGGERQTALRDSCTEGPQGAESPWLFPVPAADQDLSWARRHSGEGGTGERGRQRPHPPSLMLAPQGRPSRAPVSTPPSFRERAPSTSCGPAAQALEVNLAVTAIRPPSGWPTSKCPCLSKLGCRQTEPQESCRSYYKVRRRRPSPGAPSAQRTHGRASPPGGSETNPTDRWLRSSEGRQRGGWKCPSPLGRREDPVLTRGDGGDRPKSSPIQAAGGSPNISRRLFDCLLPSEAREGVEGERWAGTGVEKGCENSRPTGVISLGHCTPALPARPHVPATAAASV